MLFDVIITIALKEGMLDPEARAIQNALAHLGIPTLSLSTARRFCIGIDAVDREEAGTKARAICERLLANPVIHRYEIEVV
ncbi:MAG TPA: phosphoribosylformylglycinamidine synthase subunit PurS [Methanoregulaceae archaeon]|nr:phosphoribosylformylglycinamidine synthase subunit PurS [Methanoregulaceae archaeon]